MKTVLLTGATGFLGSCLLDALLKDGYRVVVLKRSTSNCWRIKHFSMHVKTYDIDLQDLDLVFTEQKIDFVFHTACSYGRKGESISEILAANVVFGLRLVDTCLKHNVETFFNTDTALPKHLNFYSLSKKQFAEWLQHVSNKIRIVNMKLDYMYGPKDDTSKFVPWVIQQLSQHVPEIKLMSGIQARNFIFIDDVVSAYMTVLRQVDLLPEVSDFEIGAGESIPMKKFLETLKVVYEGRNGEVPTQFNFGAIPYRKGEVMTVEMNSSSLENLGWQPKTTHEQGLFKMVEIER